METGHSGMSSQAFPTHTGTARHTAELLLSLPQAFRCEGSFPVSCTAQAPLMTSPLLHTTTGPHCNEKPHRGDHWAVL